MKDDTLLEWEAEAKKGDWVEDERILALIKLVRRKDELIRYCLGPTRDVKTPKLQEALALTEKLK